MRTRRQNFFLILSLGVLFALTPFTIDLYLPAFPQIAADLHTSVASISLTISLYFVGFAFGQILYGPFLDRFGRKPPLYFGLGLYMIASVGCMLSQSLNELICFRLLSAVGGSVASVGAMTMVRDFFPTNQVSGVMSMLMLVLSTSPLFAPTIGSLWVDAWGWRALFKVLLAFAGIDFMIVWALPSQYKPDHRVSLSLVPILRTFRNIFAEPDFRTYSLAASLSFAGLFVYVAASPAVFMEGYGMSARAFGAVFAVLTGGMILGGQLNRFLVKRFKERELFRRSLSLQAMLGIVFLVGTEAGLLGFYSTLVLVFGILLCGGITSPNGSTLAIAPFKRNIGSASALFGFLELGLGALAAAAVGLLNAQGTLPMAAIIAVCSSLGWVILRLRR